MADADLHLNDLWRRFLLGTLTAPPEVTATVDINAADIQIGAVEIKDGATDTRAVVTIGDPDDADAGLVVKVAPTEATATHTADVTVDATANGVTLLASNANRKSAIFVNTGAAPCRVAIGSNPAIGTGIYLVAGAVLTLDQPYCPTGAVKAIRETSTSTTVSPTEIA